MLILTDKEKGIYYDLNIDDGTSGYREIFGYEEFMNKVKDKIGHENFDDDSVMAFSPDWIHPKTFMILQKYLLTIT